MSFYFDWSKIWYVENKTEMVTFYYLDYGFGRYDGFTMLRQQNSLIPITGGCGLCNCAACSIKLYC